MSGPDWGRWGSFYYEAITFARGEHAAVSIAVTYLRSLTYRFEARIR